MATAADAEADVVGGYNVVSQWTDTLYRPSRAGGGGAHRPKTICKQFYVHHSWTPTLHIAATATDRKWIRTPGIPRLPSEIDFILSDHIFTDILDHSRPALFRLSMFVQDGSLQCSGVVVEYRICNREVAGSTHTRFTASNLEQVANLLCDQANSASYAQRAENE